MPPSMTKNAYDGLSYSIKVASKQVAEKKMSDAALDYVEPSQQQMLEFL